MATAKTPSCFNLETYALKATLLSSETMDMVAVSPGFSKPIHSAVLCFGFRKQGVFEEGWPFFFEWASPSTIEHFFLFFFSFSPPVLSFFYFLSMSFPFSHFPLPLLYVFASTDTTRDLDLCSVASRLFITLFLSTKVDRLSKSVSFLKYGILFLLVTVYKKTLSFPLCLSWLC